MEKLNLRIFKCVVKKYDIEKAKEYFNKMEDRQKSKIVEIKEGNKHYMIKFRCKLEDFDKIYGGVYGYILGEA